MNEILTQIDWLDSIVGALFGIALPFIFTIIYNLIRRFRRINILGKWYSFNLTDKDGKTQIAKYEWYLWRSLLTGRFKARVKSLIDETIKYTAEFSFTNEYFHINGKGVEHDEYFSMTYRREYPYKEKKMYGAFLAFDYTKSPVSGISIFCRDINPPSDLLKNLTDSKIRFHLQNPVGYEIIKYNPIENEDNH